MHKRLAALALAAASVIVLSGCSTTATAQGNGDGTVQVVASTNVYGSLAAEIGGDRVTVTSLIDSIAKDPHSYEATARDRLAVQNADLVIENGGGYDAFMAELRDGADAAVITAVEFSHDYPGATVEDDGHGEEHGHADADAEADADADAAKHDHADEAAHAEADEAAHDHADADAAKHDHADEAAHADETEHEHAHDHAHIAGFNEHVWFDPHTVSHVAEQIAADLTELDPTGKADFDANAEKLAKELEAIESELAGLHEKLEGTPVFITEPLPGLLAAAAGVDDVTPDGFASAVEEGSDVAPATLLEALSLIDDGKVRAVLANAQTGGSETSRVEDAAKEAGIPVLTFSELLDTDQSYAEWMRDAISDLAALQK